MLPKTIKRSAKLNIAIYLKAIYKFYIICVTYPLIILSIKLPSSLKIIVYLKKDNFLKHQFFIFFHKTMPFFFF